MKMSNNEKPQEGPRKPFRQNPHSHRPPHNQPGVDKALHLFGVPDLRELLNQKHQEQTYFEANKSNTGNAPPCEPSYSYLKDPLRESSSAAEGYSVPKYERKGKQPFDASRGRGRRQPYIIADKDDHGRQPNTKHVCDNDNRGQQKQHLPNQCVVQHSNLEHPEIIKGNKDERNLQKGLGAKRSTTSQQNPDRQNTKHNTKTRNQQNPLNSNEQQPKHNITSEDKYIPKQKPHQGHTFSNSNRGRSGHRNQKPEYLEAVIKSPFNIKVKLSTTSGERSCFIDEANKIADIKHVPDTTPPIRGRGRGRGKGIQRNWTRGQKKNVHHNKDLDEKQGNAEVDNWDEDQVIVQTKNQNFVEDQTEQNVINSEEFGKTNIVSQEFELQQEFEEKERKFEEEKERKFEEEKEREFEEEKERQLKDECSEQETADINDIGENYESDLVKNLQESFVITATNLKDDENVIRSVQLMAQIESEEGTNAVQNQ